METSEKIIEDLCWGDIFKTHNVVDYCIGFIVLIVVLRGINILFDYKVLNIYVHVIKALVYGVLVIMLCVYFSKDVENIDKINIFTGFTFVFSVIEVTDNLSTMVVDIFGQGHISRKIKKAYKEKDENTFNIVKSILDDLYITLKPGKVSSETKKYIKQLGKIYDETNFNFRSVDKIVSEDNNHEWPVNRALWDIWTDRDIQNIHWKIKNETDGIISPKLTLSIDDCMRLQGKIDVVRELHVTYINNKDKLIKEKEKSDIANQEN